MVNAITKGNIQCFQHIQRSAGRAKSHVVDHNFAASKWHVLFGICKRNIVCIGNSGHQNIIVVQQRESVTHSDKFQ